ncbi:MAG: hypothetical protein D6803_07275, partial [Anaerolineae bacterium]
MTLPALIFGILFSTLLGALFHLLRGGGAGRLLLYLLVSWLGFWAGHAWGVAQNWDFIRLGPLRLGAAGGGSLLLLI